MGPPSRYSLYAAAYARAQQSQDTTPVQTVLDPASLSNTQLAKYFLRLFATAATSEELISRANSAFSRNTNITVNGVHLSRELYAQQWGASFGAAGTISFGGAMETLNVRIPMLQNPVLVGVFYEADFTVSVDGMSAVSRSAQPTIVSVSSTINLIIAEDKTLPPSSADRRRIVSVNQVIVDKDGLLTFPLRNS